jgi:hypothetical protein
MVARRHPFIAASKHSIPDAHPRIYHDREENPISGRPIYAARELLAAARRGESLNVSNARWMLAGWAVD